MAEPVTTVRIDWSGDGAFTQAIDDVSARVVGALGWNRGRSADFSAEAQGSASFTLRNDDFRYTPDRNWHDNPSFEGGTTGWSAAAIASLTAAATSISQVTDNATGGGSKAGEAVLTATLNSGVAYAIPHKFRSGVTYSVTVWLKSMSGNLNVRAGLASSGTPADIASSGANITTSWAEYAFTWTPSADRTDAVFFVRTTTAAAATLRIDAVQVNPGAAANAYLEAPTKGQLVPGRPVHIYATYSAVDYPLFFGYIERLAPDPEDRTVSITCYDVLRRLAETDVVVAAQTFTSRSARDFRREVLEDFERGTRNLISNPEFATDTADWFTSGTLTRITTDGPPVAAGTTCGELVTTAVDQLAAQYARLTPVFLAGQVYRLSVYLRAPGTIVEAKIGFHAGGVETLVTVTPSAAWARYTVTLTMPSTVSASMSTSLRAIVKLPAAGTIRIGAVSVTRGQALYPYAATGAGRAPNWVGNGSFDAGVLNGWHNAWTNLCSNGDFETDVAGWTEAADAFNAAGASAPTRITTHPYYGSASMQLSTTAVASSGAHIVLSGTFAAGRTVRVYARVGYYSVNGGVYVGIGSQGTPADKAEQLQSVTPTAYATAYSFTWTPSANRSDVHLYVRQQAAASGTMSVDGVAVFLRSASATTDPPYAPSGPGGGGVPVTAVAISTTARWGAKSQQADTPATATAGRVYDFAHLGGYFVGGRAYTLSLWLRPTSNMPYKVGLSANKGDGTFDEASTTGTATANVWTQITLTWTPSANRSAEPTFETFFVVGFVYQTDATARTFLIDGVRVIPGSSADDYEMAHWSLDVEGDVYDLSADLSGSALAALSTINAATLARHYIRPEMASPFYTYVSSSRDSLAAKASAETFDGVDFAGVALEIDRATIVNIVPVYLSTGATVYYGDADSTARYGPRPTGTLGTGTLVLDSTIADAVGPALIARYKDPLARPQLTRSSQFPSQLARELDDLVVVNTTVAHISGAKYLILALSTTVSSPMLWETTYTLEEFP